MTTAPASALPAPAVAAWADGVDAVAPLFENAEPLLAVAVVLLAGLAVGRLFQRFGMPAVTGQILAGILLGPSLAQQLGFRPVFDRATLDGLEPLTGFALALVAVTIGSHLNFQRLRNAGRRLAWLALAEAIVTPVLVFAAVKLVRPGAPELALLLAALAVSTAPATIVALVKETRSKGVFVRTLIASVALNNMACILLFELARAAVRAGSGGLSNGELLLALATPLRTLVYAAALGGGAGLLLIAGTRHVVRSDRLATASFVAILGTAGLAHWLDCSPLLSCMFLGLTLANVTPDKDELGHAAFSDFETAIYAIFFTLAGMELEFGYIATAGLIALPVFLARGAGKAIAANLAMRIAGATDRVRRYLGLSLLPQAGVAVGLMLVVQDEPSFAGVRDLLLAVGLTVVTANEIVGPILTRAGLRRSGDFGKDRARLIDFLREENIVTGLKVRHETMEEAIHELCRIAVATNHLKIDPEELFASVMEREREVSTCVGGGLAVPHGALPEGDRIYGAMGISRRGLDVPTPDGRRLHCIVLLATPPGQRERHLEVLAALARAIGSDPSVQARLFDVDTPAHAYEILHAEEATGFNYWLE
jgi:PTS system fructose-specific IIC component